MITLRLMAVSAMLFVSLVLPAAAQAPSGAVYSSEPYSSGSFFATSKCVTQKFACGSLPRSQMTSIANICAEETFGISNIMGEVGNASNGYKGCALPTTFVSDPNAPLKKKWTVCCIVPAKTGDMCTMDCHLYYNNK